MPDPLPWLLERDDPAVRHVALRDVLGRAADDPEVVEARGLAMCRDPIASILAAQRPEGGWEKPGPGCATKYRGTVWQLIFLDQLGADPADERVRRACDYVLGHVSRWYASGTCGPGFACAANEGQPCAWGAIKALGGLARIPAGRRSPLAERAAGMGADVLLGRDPAAGTWSGDALLPRPRQ